MKQKYIMLESEGDAWFERNRDQLGLHDPVTDVIGVWTPKPHRILEIGCANGWRLAKLRDRFGCEVYGVEPSLKAAMAAAANRVPVYQQTASCLPVVYGGFDLIIYGFCLYLADPEDWLLIAAEGDRALADGGHIIIHDFDDVEHVRSEIYKHDQRLKSYHFDFARLWLAHPEFKLVATLRGPENRVTVLQRKSK